MVTDLSFDDAFARLENLVADIENENIRLDELASKVRSANDLIRFCEEKLRTISSDIELAKQPQNDEGLLPG